MIKKLSIVFGLTAAMILAANGVSPSALAKTTNVALNKPTAASSVRDRPDLGQYHPPEYAVDGIWNTKEHRWLSGTTVPPHWLEVDLDGTFELVGAEVWTGDQTSNANFAVTEFKLQYWENGDWVDIPGASVYDNPSEHVTFTFREPVITSKVRFYSEERSIIRLAELLVFGKAVN